jgi:hypothetical protein
MHPISLVLQLHVATALGAVAGRAHGLLARTRTGRERGQSTAEYALVLLGAATVAIVFLAWAGKTSRIGKLFDAVLDTVIGKV